MWMMQMMMWRLVVAGLQRCSGFPDCARNWGHRRRGRGARDMVSHIHIPDPDFFNCKGESWKKTDSFDQLDQWVDPRFMKFQTNYDMAWAISVTKETTKMFRICHRELWEYLTCGCREMSYLGFALVGVCQECLLIQHFQEMIHDCSQPSISLPHWQTPFSVNHDNPVEKS